MRARNTRELAAADAVAMLRTELDNRAITAQMTGHGSGRVRVLRCELEDPARHVAVQGSGRGEDTQAEASALFETWERYCHITGFDSMRFDGGRTRLMRPAEIISQPALTDDAMLSRLAKDHPGRRVGCLLFDPFFNAAEPLWYPGFARFPWCKQYPIPGDDGRHTAYLRYSTALGTAAGTSESESLLHALLEAIEGDAFSIALLDWYADRGTPPWRVHTKDLPADLQQLSAEAGKAIGYDPLVFDVSTDLQVPAFAAVPSCGGYPGVCGEGASVTPGYAIERALSELVQAHACARDDPDQDTHLRRRLASLAEWPTLSQCVMLDPDDLVARAEPMPRRPPDWWDPAGKDIAEGLACQPDRPAQPARLPGLLAVLEQGRIASASADRPGPRA